MKSRLTSSKCRSKMNPPGAVVLESTGPGLAAQRREGGYAATRMRAAWPLSPQARAVGPMLLLGLVYLLCVLPIVRPDVEISLPSVQIEDFYVTRSSLESEQDSIHAFEFFFKSDCPVEAPCAPVLGSVIELEFPPNYATDTFGTQVLRSDVVVEVGGAIISAVPIFFSGDNQAKLAAVDAQLESSPGESDANPRSTFWGISRRIRLKITSLRSDASAWPYYSIKLRLKNPGPATLTPAQAAVHTAAGAETGNPGTTNVNIRLKDFRARVYSPAQAAALEALLTSPSLSELDVGDILAQEHPQPVPVQGIVDSSENEGYGGTLIEPTLPYEAPMEIAHVQSLWGIYDGSISFALTAPARPRLPSWSQLFIRTPAGGDDFSISSVRLQWGSLESSVSSVAMKLQDTMGSTLWKLESASPSLQRYLELPVNVTVELTGGPLYSTNDVELGVFTPGGAPLLMRRFAPFAWRRAGTFSTYEWNCGECVLGQTNTFSFQFQYPVVSDDTTIFIITFHSALAITASVAAPSCHVTSGNWQYEPALSAGSELKFSATSAPHDQLSFECDLPNQATYAYLLSRMSVTAKMVDPITNALIMQGAPSDSQYYRRYCHKNLQDDQVTLIQYYPKVGVTLASPELQLYVPHSELSSFQRMRLQVPSEPGFSGFAPGNTLTFTLYSSKFTAPVVSCASNYDCTYNMGSLRLDTGSSLRIALPPGGKGVASAALPGRLMLYDYYSVIGIDLPFLDYTFTWPTAPANYPEITAQWGLPNVYAGSPQKTPFVFRLSEDDYLLSGTYCNVVLPTHTSFQYLWGSYLEAQIYEGDVSDSDETILNSTPSSIHSLQFAQTGSTLNVTLPTITKIPPSRRVIVKLELPIYNSTAQLSVPHFSTLGSQGDFSCNHYQLLQISEALVSNGKYAIVNNPKLEIQVHSESDIGSTLTTMWFTLSFPYESSNDATIQLRNLQTHVAHWSETTVTPVFEEEDPNAWVGAQFTFKTDTKIIEIKPGVDHPITPGTVVRFGIANLMTGEANVPPVEAFYDYIRSAMTATVPFTMPRTATLQLEGSSVLVTTVPEGQEYPLPVPGQPARAELLLVVPGTVTSNGATGPWTLSIAFFDADLIRRDLISGEHIENTLVVSEIKYIHAEDSQEPILVVPTQTVQPNATAIEVTLPEEIEFPSTFAITVDGLVIPSIAQQWSTVTVMVTLQSSNSVLRSGEILLTHVLPDQVVARQRAAALGPFNIRDTSSNVTRRAAWYAPQPVTFTGASRTVTHSGVTFTTAFRFAMPNTQVYNRALDPNGLYLYLTLPLAVLRDPTSDDWALIAKYPPIATPFPRVGDLTQLASWTQLVLTTPPSGRLGIVVKDLDSEEETTSPMTSIQAADIQCYIVPRASMLLGFEAVPMSVCAVKLPLEAFTPEIESEAGSHIFSKQGLLRHQVASPDAIDESLYEVSLLVELENIPQRPLPGGDASDVLIPPPFTPWRVQAQVSGIGPQQQGYPIRGVELELPISESSEPAAVYDVPTDVPEGDTQEEREYALQSSVLSKVYASPLDYPLNLPAAPISGGTNSVLVTTSSRISLSTFTLTVTVKLPPAVLPLAGGERIRIRLPTWHALQLSKQSKNPVPAELLSLQVDNLSDDPEIAALQMNWQRGDRPATIQALVNGVPIATEFARSESQTTPGPMMTQPTVAKVSRSGETYPLGANGLPVETVDLGDTLPDTFTVLFPVRVPRTALENALELRVVITHLMHPFVELTQLAELSAEASQIVVSLLPPARFISRALALGMSLPVPYGDEIYPNAVSATFPPVSLVANDVDFQLTPIPVLQSYAQVGGSVWTRLSGSSAYTANDYEISLGIPHGLLQATRDGLFDAFAAQHSSTYLRLPYVFIIEFTRPNFLHSFEAISLMIPHSSNINSEFSTYDVTPKEVSSIISRDSTGTTPLSSTLRLRVPVRLELAEHLYSLSSETIPVRVKVVFHRVRLSAAPTLGSTQADITMHPTILSPVVLSTETQMDAEQPYGIDVFRAESLAVVATYQYLASPIALATFSSLPSMPPSLQMFASGSSFRAIPSRADGLTRDEILTQNPTAQDADLPSTELLEGQPITIQVEFIWPSSLQDMFDAYSDVISIELPLGWIPETETFDPPLYARFAVVGQSVEEVFPELAPSNPTPPVLDILSITHDDLSTKLLVRVKYPLPLDAPAAPIVALPLDAIGSTSDTFRFIRGPTGFARLSAGDRLRLRIGPFVYPDNAAPRSPVRAVIQTHDNKSGTGQIPSGQSAAPFQKALLSSSTHLEPGTAGEAPRPISLNYADAVTPTHAYLALGSAQALSTTTADFVMRSPPVYASLGVFSDFLFSAQISIPIASTAEVAVQLTTPQIDEYLSMSATTTGVSSTTDDDIIALGGAPAYQWSGWGEIFSATVEESPISIAEEDYSESIGAITARTPLNLQRIAINWPSGLVARFNALATQSLQNPNRPQLVILVRFKTFVLPGAQFSTPNGVAASPLISVSSLYISGSIRYADRVALTKTGAAAVGLVPLRVAAFKTTPTIALQPAFQDSVALPYSGSLANATVTVPLPSALDVPANTYILHFSLPLAVTFGVNTFEEWRAQHSFGTSDIYRLDVRIKPDASTEELLLLPFTFTPASGLTRSSFAIPLTTSIPAGSVLTIVLPFLHLPTYQDLNADPLVRVSIRSESVSGLSSSILAFSTSTQSIVAENVPWPDAIGYRLPYARISPITQPLLGSSVSLVLTLESLNEPFPACTSFTVRFPSGYDLSGIDPLLEVVTATSGFHPQLASNETSIMNPDENPTFATVPLSVAQGGTSNGLRQFMFALGGPQARAGRVAFRLSGIRIGSTAPKLTQQGVQLSALDPNGNAFIGTSTVSEYYSLAAGLRETLDSLDALQADQPSALSTVLQAATQELIPSSALNSLTVNFATLAPLATTDCDIRFSLPLTGWPAERGSTIHIHFPESFKLALPSQEDIDEGAPDILTTPSLIKVRFFLTAPPDYKGSWNVDPVTLEPEVDQVTNAYLSVSAAAFAYSDDTTDPVILDLANKPNSAAAIFFEGSLMERQSPKITLSITLPEMGTDADQLADVASILRGVSILIPGLKLGPDGSELNPQGGLYVTISNPYRSNRSGLPDSYMISQTPAPLSVVASTSVFTGTHIVGPPKCEVESNVAFWTNYTGLTVSFDHPIALNSVVSEPDVFATVEASLAALQSTVSDLTIVHSAHFQCGHVVSRPTLRRLGRNPKCAIRGDRLALWIWLGNDATILPEDLEINPEVSGGLDVLGRYKRFTFRSGGIMRREVIDNDVTYKPLVSNVRCSLTREVARPPDTPSPLPSSILPPISISVAPMYNSFPSCQPMRSNNAQVTNGASRLLTYSFVLNWAPEELVSALEAYFTRLNLELARRVKERRAIVRQFMHTLTDLQDSSTLQALLDAHGRAFTPEQASIDVGLTAAAIDGASRGSVSLPPSLTPAQASDYDVDVDITVHTWFGSSFTRTLTLTRSAGAPPRILANALTDSVIFVRRSSPAIIAFRTERGACSNVSNSNSGLTHFWTMTPLPDVNTWPKAIAALEEAQGRKEIRFPAHSLPINQPYTIKLLVTDNSTGLISEAITTLEVQSSPLTSIIAGGSRRLVSLPAAALLSNPSASALRLDGTPSGDPDVDPTISDYKLRYSTRSTSPPTLTETARQVMEHLHFQWRCYVGTSTNPNPNAVDTDEVVTLNDPLEPCPIAALADQNGVEVHLEGTGWTFSSLSLPRGAMELPSNSTTRWIFSLVVTDTTSVGREAISSQVVVAFTEMEVPEVSVEMISPTGAVINPNAMPLHLSLNLAAKVTWQGEALQLGARSRESEKSEIDPDTGVETITKTVHQFSYQWSVMENALPLFSVDDPTLRIRRTDLTAPFLVLEPRALQPGATYKFAVAVTVTTTTTTEVIEPELPPVETQSSSSPISFVALGRFVSPLLSELGFSNEDQSSLDQTRSPLPAAERARTVTVSRSTIQTNSARLIVRPGKVTRGETGSMETLDDIDETAEGEAGASFKIETHNPPADGECSVEPADLQTEMVSNPVYQEALAAVNNNPELVDPKIPMAFYPFGTQFVFACNSWVGSISPDGVSPDPLVYRFAIRIPESSSQSHNSSVNYNDAAALPPGYVALGSDFQVANSMVARLAGSYNAPVEVIAQIRDQVGGVTTVELTIPVAPFNANVSGGLDGEMAQSLLSELGSAAATGDASTVVATAAMLNQIIVSTKPELDPEQVVANGPDPTIVGACATAIQALAELISNLPASPATSDMIFTVASYFASDPLYLSPSAQLQTTSLLVAGMSMYLETDATMTPEAANQLLTSLSGVLTASALTSFLGNDSSAEKQQIGAALSAVLDQMPSVLLRGAVPDVDPILIETDSIKIVAQRRSLAALDANSGTGVHNSISIGSKWAELHPTVAVLQDSVISNYTLGHVAEPQLSNIELRYPTSVLDQHRHNFTADTAIDIVASIINNNIYAFRDNYTEEISSSQLLSLSMHPASISDGDTGPPLAIANVTEPFVFVIPHSDSSSKEYMDAASYAAQLANQSPDPNAPRGRYGSQVQHVCRYWHEQHLDWATDGCTVDMALSTTRYSVCRCNHLTIFNVAMSFAPRFIPHINTFGWEDIKNVTWDNIQKYPVPFISVMIVLGLTTILFPLAYLRDEQLERQLIYETLDTLKLMHKEGLSYPPRQEAREKEARDTIMKDNKAKFWFVVHHGLRQHLWSSIYFRATTSAFQSRERLLIISGLILVSLTLSAVFLGNQTATQMITVSILTAIGSAFVTSLVASLFVGETPALTWLLGFFMRQYAMYRLLEIKHVSNQYQAAVEAYQEYYRVQAARRKGEPEILRGSEPVTPYALSAVLAESIKRGTTLDIDVSLAPTIDDVLRTGTPMHPIPSSNDSGKSSQNTVLSKAGKVLGEKVDKSTVMRQARTRDELRAAADIVRDKTSQFTAPLMLLQRDPIHNVNDAGEAQIVPIEELDPSEVAALGEFARMTQAQFDAEWTEHWKSIIKESVKRPLYEEIATCIGLCCFKFRAFMLSTLVDKYQDGVSLELILRCMYSSAFWTMVDRFPPEAVAKAFLNRPWRDRWNAKRIAAYTLAILVILGASFLILVYGMKFDMEGKISSEQWITGVVYTNLIDVFGTKPLNLLGELLVIILFYYFWCMPSVVSYANKEKDLMTNVLRTQVSVYAEDLAKDPLISPHVSKRISRSIPPQYRSAFIEKLNSAVNDEFTERLRQYRKEKQKARLNLILAGRTDQLGQQRSLIEERIFNEAKSQDKPVFYIAKRLRTDEALDVAAEDATLDDIDTDIEEEQKITTFDLRRTSDKLQIRVRRFFKRVNELTRKYRHRKPLNVGREAEEESGKDPKRLEHSTSKSDQKRGQSRRQISAFEDDDPDSAMKELVASSSKTKPAKPGLSKVLGLDAIVEAEDAISTRPAIELQALSTTKKARGIKGLDLGPEPQTKQKSTENEKSLKYDVPDEEDEEELGTAETSKQRRTYDPVLKTYQPTYEQSKLAQRNRAAAENLYDKLGMKYDFDNVLVDKVPEIDESELSISNFDFTQHLHKSKSARQLDAVEVAQPESETSSQQPKSAKINRRGSITGVMLDAILSGGDWDPTAEDQDEEQEVPEAHHEFTRHLGFLRRDSAEPSSEQQQAAQQSASSQHVRYDENDDDDEDLEFNWRSRQQDADLRRRKLPPGHQQLEGIQERLSEFAGVHTEGVSLGLEEEAQHQRPKLPRRPSPSAESKAAQDQDRNSVDSMQHVSPRKQRSGELQEPDTDQDSVSVSVSVSAPRRVGIPTTQQFRNLLTPTGVTSLAQIQASTASPLTPGSGTKVVMKFGPAGPLMVAVPDTRQPNPSRPNTTNSTPTGGSKAAVRVHPPISKK